MLNNYKQALEIISINSKEIEKLKNKLNIEDCAFEMWHKEEQQLYQDLKEEPALRQLQIAYAEALHARAKAS